MHFLSNALTLLLIGCLASKVNAFCPAFMQNQTACTCTDYVDGAIIKCNGPQGPLIVEELKKAQTEVRQLSLENANIVEIGPRAFKNLRIKKLVLDNNKIVTIQKDAFRGLESVLQELSINQNKLAEIPTEALVGLRALNTLSLRCNEIGNITDVVFQNVPSLIELNLACNQICKINGNAFNEIKNTLQNLILDNNCLHYIPTQAIDGMHYMIALHIKYNKIGKLGKNDLRNLTNLLMITLTGNNISHISKKFIDNVPNLRYIYLGENALSSIEPGTMKQFAQSEIIDISYNNLPEITVDLFSGMENLQHLNLEANAIKDIAPGAFATTPLLLLWLAHNCLSSIAPNMFQGTPFLKQVSLAHNNIHNIKAFSFAHLANLHTLDLSHNKIQTLQQSAIMGSDFLTVRVQENPFVCNQDGFHVMNGREAINHTVEANLVCQTDYLHDSADKCPRQLKKPARQSCCRSYSIKKTAVKLETTTENPTNVTKSFIRLTTTTAKSISLTTESRAAMRARKLNMKRFMRLQRRPTDLKLNGHFKAPQDSVVAANGIPIESKNDKITAETKQEPDNLNQIQKNDEETVKQFIKPSATYEKVKDPQEIAETNDNLKRLIENEEFNHDSETQTIIKDEEHIAKRS